MNILVTGGLGFIGSHLVRKLLLNPNCVVHVVDNLSNTVLTREEIVAAITADRPGQLVCHIMPVDEYTPHPSLRFDKIFHLASVVGPAAVLNYAGRIASRIVADTYRMVQLAAKNSCRLIFVSTSEVYGGGEAGYCQEETPRVFRGRASARQEYAAAKMACEVSLQNLVTTSQLDAVIIRPFNVAGSRQQGLGGFVVPRFVGQATLGRPLTIFGDGTQLRAFTDVRDVASGIELVSQRGEPGETYNVGNPVNRVSIESLADCVLKITRSNSPKDFIDPTTIYGEAYADAADKFPDAGKLGALGWKPQHSVDDVVSSVVCEYANVRPERIILLAALETQSLTQLNGAHESSATVFVST